MAPPASAPAPAAAPSPPRRPRLLLVLVWGALAVALGAGGAAAWLLLGRGERAEATGRRPTPVFRAGTVIVNIAETEGRRYLRATIELGAATPEDLRRLEAHRTPILDGAIGVLGATSLPALLDPAGREHLKDRLRARINATVGGEVVSQVFFTEFVVQ